MSSRAAMGRLVGAELRGRRLRAMALLFVVVVLAAAALVAGLETQARAGDQWDRAFAGANGAHVSVGARDGALLRRIASDPRVSEASAPYPTLEDGLEIRSGGKSEDLLVRQMARDAIPPVAKPLLRDGRWVAPGARDEIVLDRAYALDRHVAVGDRITVRQDGRDAAFTVVGRAVDLIDCFYPLCDPVPSWVDPAGYARFAHTGEHAELFLRLHDPQRVDEFTSDLENRYGDKVGTNDWIDTRDDTLIISGFFGAFLSGFGVFVMVAAALVVLGSMASRVVARRRDIGLLKAVGVTPRQVALSVLAAHVLVTALGVVVGWVLGGFLSGRLQLNVGRVLGGDGASLPFSRLVVALVVVELIVVVAIAVPAYRTGRLPTVAALSGAATGSKQRSRLASLAERIGVGPVGVAGVRDAFARRSRSVFTVLALAVAIVAVVVSMGFNRTVDHAFENTAVTGDPYDLAASPAADADAPAVARAFDANADVTSWFTTTERRALVGDASYLVRALGGDVAHSGYAVESGRLPRTASEAIAGYGFLQETGTNVGDDVTLRLGGQPATFHIVGWYSDTEDTGQVLMVTLAGLRRVAPEAVAEGFHGHVRDGVAPERVAASLQSALRGTAQVGTNVPESNDEINAFRTTFWVFTIFVLIVAFANLASTLLLAVRERTRDLGVLRSVGFTPRQVVSVSAIGAGSLALVAAIIGVPLGWALYRLLMKAVGTGAGIGPNLGVNPAVLSVALLFPVSVAVAMLIGTAVTRRAATAEVSDLVRYE